MWQEATNTFNEGLVMDLNPLTTPNNVLTSCLNGTIITYNGNEYVLQNDMGNGRVESAYLPVGYIPVGMTEFGGIVYVISYNPQLDKSQIGSFPSPERNISSEERSKSEVVLDNPDFGYDTNTGASTGASIFYVQKDLYEDKLNPGDKFIVYANKGEITGNEEKLDELKEDNQTKLVRLSLATITDEGKIVKLTNLKKYEIEGGYTYIIPEMEKNSETGFPDVDSYRTITESPYNVFNSKVSGKLLLIAELITIDSFNVVTDVEFEGTQTEKDAKIKVSMNYESEDNVYLYAVSGKVTDGTQPPKSVSYEWPGNTREESEVLLYPATNYNIQERPQRDILWELTPCMKFGPIPYLKKSGIVELDKVGTGFIDLSEWRYYIDNSNLQLNWALQSYPEPGYKITKVRFVLKKFEADGTTVSTITYNISDKKSYNGSFTEIIPFNSVFYKIAENKQLEKNQLYGVTIEVDYGNGNTDTNKTLRFYRFLYTTDVFNKKYIEGKVSDFESLKPELNITTTTKYNFEKISQTQSEQLGKMVTNEEILEAETLSATSIYTNLKLTGEIIPSLTKDYNLFVVDESSVQVGTEINKGDITFGPYSVTYTQSDSVNMNNYLELRENTGYQGGEVELPTQDRMSELVNEDSKINYDSGLCIKESNIQNQKFDVIIDIVEFIKAFAKPSKETITYKGILRPVAYDEETFGNYNLKLDSGKFIGTATCAFGQYEEGGHDGNEWYFDATGDKLQYQTRSVEPIDDITTEFSSNESQNAMNTAWKSLGNSSIAVCIYQYPVEQQHHLIVENKDINTNWPWYRGIYSGDGNPDKQVSYNKGCDRNNVWNNKDDGKSAVFIFMKGTDGKWYAINMVFNMGFKTYAINLSHLKFNNYLVDESNNNRHMADAFYNIYTVLASMLNQMYAYREETQTEQKYIPVSIYYIPKYTTNFNLNINNTISTDENTEIQIILSENVKKPLSEYRTRTTELFNELSLDNLNTNNITPELTSTNESIVATYKTQNSGIDLRDKILEYQKNRYGALIITNTGEVLTSESNLNPQNLYYILDNAPKKLDKNFKFKKVYDWNAQYIPQTIIDDAVSSQNIANKFTMLDGQLRLNESFAPPKTRLFRGSTEQTDDGGIGTFSDFAPIDFLKCWEGS